MNDENKRGIFFGVVGVLTLIVAIIGASLAYFSINANSEKDALTVQAATVQIVYKDGGKIEVDKIIPSSKAVALETIRRAIAKETYPQDNGEGGTTQVVHESCRDDNGYTVCGVYEFDLTNNGINPVDIVGKIIPTLPEVAEGEEETQTPTEKQFKNLKFALYDITGVEGTATGNEIVEEGSVTYAKEGFDIMPSTINLAKNEKKSYRLLLWLKETDASQNDEQGATFKGTVYINVPGAGNVTGTATGVPQQ